MFTFFIFLLAVVAIVIAIHAHRAANALREEVRELTMRLDAQRTADHAANERLAPEAPASAVPPGAPVQPPVERPVEPAPAWPPTLATARTAPPPPRADEPEIPRYIPPAAEPPAAPASSAWNIDWENLVGIKLFSWIAGIALVLAAVFLFKYSVEHGWLRPAVRATFGLLTGIGLLVVCELRIARNYRFTANAMLGAGIAILYATLFALHGRWHLWPAAAAFAGMLLVTAAAVFLSTRRDSVFIALLGLLGGFATPALLSSGENRPIALFSYLLLLNGGIAWIAFRQRWPLLTGVSIALTAFYQWAWVERFLTKGELPIAAGIFIVFAAIGASSLWPRADDRPAAFRRIATAGAVLPLLFAFFTAIVPEYGARYHVLFGFLLLIVTGLAAIAIWRGPAWLHGLGGLASLITFFLWLTISYPSDSYPSSLLWVAAFVTLYLAADLRLRDASVFTAPLLFFVFIGTALRGWDQHETPPRAMFALLAVVVVFALMRARPYVAAVAIALSSLAILPMWRADAPVVMTSHGVLLVTLMVVAWISERHILVVLALPFAIAALVQASTFAPETALAFAAVLYALFLAYPVSLGARVKESLAPHAAAALASFIFFVQAYILAGDLGFADAIGAIAIAQALLMLGLMWSLLHRDPVPERLGILGVTALVLLTIAVTVQLDGNALPIGWAVEAAALAWLWTRVRHGLLIAWSGTLFVAVLVWPAPHYGPFEHYQATYAICAAAMFVSAWLAGPLRKLAGASGSIELFILLNIAIADYYSGANASALASDLTYTICWALFAIAMLVAGLVLASRAARVAALALLLVTVLKCFLHDLGQLGGLYRVASLFGLAVSLVLVGVMLQKFVMMKRTSPPADTPAPAPPPA